MYGMSPKRKFIDRALALLAERVDGAMVIVFHRDTSLDINGLVCLHTASFPSSAVSVPDEDEHLDNFATFIAGFAPQQTDSQNATLQGWRNVCRALCDQEKSHTGHLFFGAPNIMMAFTRHATTLGELTAEVPLAKGIRVKRRRHPTAFVVRPTELSQVQKCVRWSLEHKLSLAIIGGGHSGHCLQPNIVSVDMAAFDNVDVLQMKGNGEVGPSLIVAGAGCRSETIIKKAMAAGLTVPLGSRPSVGAGLWLQGGIGHLSRLQGLACDAIVGAVMVSVESGQVLVIGIVPSQHQPNDAIRPENEADLLWALKGAGTNFGVVTNVVFKAYPAMVYSVRQWVSPLSDRQEAQQRLVDIDALARELPRQTSADAYLYCDSEGLHVAVSLSECAIAGHDTESFAGSPSAMTAFLGPENSSKTVDAIGLYDTEMYISFLITGDTGVGKDYCAKVLASDFTKHHEDLRVRVVSISDATKAQYTAATGADLARMLHDQTRQARRGLSGDDADTAKDGYVPTLSFDNEETGNEAARQFAERSLFPFLHSDLRRLENMVPPIPGFPRSGICFRHVLNIVQQPGGLGLCTALLRTHFPGNWNGIDAIAGCETGGLIFASALAISVIKPLVPIRKAGKLPPPTVSADKSSSHISSASSNAAIDTRIEADEGILCQCKSVVVVDDVLATGKTLCAVLGLLNKAGVASECISVIILSHSSLTDFGRPNRHSRLRDLALEVSIGYGINANLRLLACSRNGSFNRYDENVSAEHFSN
ncbi:hypothetical protein MY8738_003099 [Beauveria namnaoensis]